MPLQEVAVLGEFLQAFLCEGKGCFLVFPYVEEGFLGGYRPHGPWGKDDEGEIGPFLFPMPAVSEGEDFVLGYGDPGDEVLLAERECHRYAVIFLDFIRDMPCGQDEPFSID